MEGIIPVNSIVSYAVNILGSLMFDAKPLYQVISVKKPPYLYVKYIKNAAKVTPNTDLLVP